MAASSGKSKEKLTKSLQILELKEGATENDIKSAYKRKALEKHPDKNLDNPEATAEFQELTEAYTYLCKINSADYESEDDDDDYEFYESDYDLIYLLKLFEFLRSQKSSKSKKGSDSSFRRGSKPNKPVRVIFTPFGIHVIEMDEGPSVGAKRRTKAKSAADKYKFSCESGGKKKTSEAVNNNRSTKDFMHQYYDSDEDSYTDDDYDDDGCCYCEHHQKLRNRRTNTPSDDNWTPDLSDLPKPKEKKKEKKPEFEPAQPKKKSKKELLKEQRQKEEEMAKIKAELEEKLRKEKEKEEKRKEKERQEKNSNDVTFRAKPYNNGHSGATGRQMEEAVLESEKAKEKEDLLMKEAISNTNDKKSKSRRKREAKQQRRNRKITDPLVDDSVIPDDSQSLYKEYQPSSFSYKPQAPAADEDWGAEVDGFSSAPAPSSQSSWTGDDNNNRKNNDVIKLGHVSHTVKSSNHDENSFAWGGTKPKKSTQAPKPTGARSNPWGQKPQAALPVWKPPIVAAPPAPPPSKNIWQERLEVDHSRPQTAEEEDDMLRAALEMSRIQAEEEELLRKMVEKQQELEEHERMIREKERLMEEERRAAEERRLAEERHIAQEQRRAEERRRQEELRIAEERRRQEIRLAEERRRHEEARLEEERRLQAEARLAEERRIQKEMKLSEERRMQEEMRLAEEMRMKDEMRLAEEKRLADERFKRENVRQLGTGMKHVSSSPQSQFKDYSGKTGWGREDFTENWDEGMTSAPKAVPSALNKLPSNGWGDNNGNSKTVEPTKSGFGTVQAGFVQDRPRRVGRGRGTGFANRKIEAKPNALSSFNQTKTESQTSNNWDSQTDNVETKMSTMSIKSQTKAPTTNTYLPGVAKTSTNDQFKPNTDDVKLRIPESWRKRPGSSVSPKLQGSNANSTGFRPPGIGAASPTGDDNWDDEIEDVPLQVQPVKQQGSKPITQIDYKPPPPPSGAFDYKPPPPPVEESQSDGGEGSSEDSSDYELDEDDGAGPVVEGERPVVEGDNSMKQNRVGTVKPSVFSEPKVNAQQPHPQMPDLNAFLTGMPVNNMYGAMPMMPPQFAMPFAPAMMAPGAANFAQPAPVAQAGDEQKPNDVPAQHNPGYNIPRYGMPTMMPMPMMPLLNPQLLQMQQQYLTTLMQQQQQAQSGASANPGANEQTDVQKH